MITAVPAQVDYHQPERSRLSSRALVYLTFIGAAAAVATIAAFARMETPTRSTWWDFAILTTGAAIAQLFVVTTTRNQSMHAALVFAVPAVMMLPPGLIVLMAAVIHIPEWLKERYPWFIQTFNACNWCLSALAAWAVSDAILSLGGSESGTGDVNDRYALAGVAAAAAFVLLNHLLLSIMLRFARGHSFHQSGLFGLESLGTDFVLADARHSVVAGLWTTDPWLVPSRRPPPADPPLAPAGGAPGASPRRPEDGPVQPAVLQRGAHRRARSRATVDRPFSLIMADLDLLREMNNNYGHLAGDAVLFGVAEIFRAQLRHFDVPARFGGEEFSILLPETHARAGARGCRADPARRRRADFDVETSTEPIRATVSIGVAGVPKDGTDANELIHQADLAVYRAKLQGRNRVLGATDRAAAVPRRAGRRAVMPEGRRARRAAPARSACDHRKSVAARGRMPDTGARFWPSPGDSRPGRGLVSVVGLAAGHRRLLSGASTTCSVLSRSSSSSGQARRSRSSATRQQVDLGQRRRRACRRRALRPGCGAPARRHDRPGRVERPAHVDPPVLFNIGSLTLASLAAAGVFPRRAGQRRRARRPSPSLGFVAGVLYFLSTPGL